MKITEIQLLTDRMEETIYFYRDILGLSVIITENKVTKFSAGASVLTFHQSYNNSPVYHFAFNIPKNQFNEALHWAASKFQLIQITASGSVADFQSWNAKAFYFYDNNHNIVEFIARFDLDNDSQQPFDGSSVCSISEMGLVVKDPKTFAAKLMAAYHLAFFEKQLPKEDFIAMGNDEGLLIIVSENRVWYPTDNRSAKHWAKVSIAFNGQPIEIMLD